MFVPLVTSALAATCAATALKYPRQATNNTSSYAVKEPPLDTPWTYEAGTDPWPEYPRPQLKRSQWQSLNGIWTYQNASSLDAVNNPPFNQALSNEVLVPSCLESGLSGTIPTISHQLISVLLTVGKVSKGGTRCTHGSPPPSTFLPNGLESVRC